MFDKDPWTFERTRPRSARRDPFEAEFFTGEGETEESHGRTDSLVREVLQNSLDASLRSGPVRVRFAFSGNDGALRVDQSTRYMAGLLEHLDALGNPTVNRRNGAPTMPFLLIEDFGTKGLTGDPRLTTDPAPAAAENESFYWFWRNIGRSGKRGTALGRWGLGKTVFPSASRINAFFGYTIRADDHRRLLMGQAITKIHKLPSGREYEPEGFFHDAGADAEAPQFPFTQEQILKQFAKDFQLARDDESGLSVVVPYPLDFVNSTDIMRSVVVHFFLPILKHDLIVEVSNFGGGVTRIDADTIRDVAAALAWKGGLSDKKHGPPPLDFAKWAILQQRESSFRFLNPAGELTAPQWNEGLFPPAVLEELRARFANGERIAVRVPLTIELKTGQRNDTYFDAFLEPAADVGKGEDYFVREGMTISQIATLGGVRAVRGIVLVDHEHLSGLLGDAEGPAHTKWGESEQRPGEKYDKWISRVRFVKNSLSKLVQYLSPPPEKLDVDLLQSIFSIDDPKKPGHAKRKGRDTTDGDGPPEPPTPPGETKPRPFEVVRLTNPSGFRINPSENVAPTAARIRVRVAYDVPEGSPFSRSNYSPFDFTFDEGKSSPVKLVHSGITFTRREDNELIFDTGNTGFDVSVTGFDPLRDVIVDVKEVSE
jgi:hypothetical protein